MFNKLSAHFFIFFIKITPKIYFRANDLCWTFK